MARQTIRRGRNVVMKLGDSEVDYDPNFKLYLQTKLNPHYKPEIAAQTTLVNFCVTEKAWRTSSWRWSWRKAWAAAVLRFGAPAPSTPCRSRSSNNLLFRLANSQGDILEDIELIENLEETKRTAAEMPKSRAGDGDADGDQ